MQLPVTRRLLPRESTLPGTWAPLGFGAGFVAGFLLSEGFGNGRNTRVARLAKTFGRQSGPKENPIALHGWVTGRAIRTRTWRLAQTIARPAPVDNRLVVRGADVAPTPLDPDEEPGSA